MMSKYTGESKISADDGREMRTGSAERLSPPVSASYSGSVITGEEPEMAAKTPGRRWLKMSAAVLLAIAAVGAIAGYFYWQDLKTKPQYSLALLIDAARRDDQAAISELIDTDAAVDAFVPQVTSKAIELYGRGLPPETLARVERIATPLLPAVKDRAREELPRLIREKTAKFESVPFAGMVLGADRYLEIGQTGNEATVVSKLPEHSFEVRMTKSGARWKIVSVRDEKLATKIAQRIGQEIIAIAGNGRDGKAVRPANLRNIQDVLREAQEIFK